MGERQYRPVDWQEVLYIIHMQGERGAPDGDQAVNSPPKAPKMGTTRR